jgi:hypothetical protein
MAKKDSEKFLATIRGNNYDNLMPLLEAMYKEFQALSKSKPDATLSKKKVEMVNRLLKEVFTILEGESNKKFLDLLDEEDLPHNSDVVLILGQTVAAMERFRKKHYNYISEEWF